MSKPDQTTLTDENRSIYCDYILGVRIRKIDLGDRDSAEYRFEAPEHCGVAFDDPDLAELYADIYFDVNGFEERGTGERGVPPEVIQAGRDTLAAYFLTQPGTDINWIASFYGKKPTKIERYVASVRKRGRDIRAQAQDRGLS